MFIAHRAIISVYFIFSVRCGDAVSYFLSFTANGPRVDPSCHLSAAACASVCNVQCCVICGEEITTDDDNDDAGAPTRPSSEGLYCSRGFLSRGPRGERSREVHGEMVRNDGRVLDHVDIT